MAKADVEELTVSWLQSIVGNEWSVSGNKPKQLPTQFITVDRTGGPRESIVLDKAEILIEVYHKNSRTAAKNKAYDIADRVVELAAYNENITRAAVNSVVNLDDLLGKYQRYQIYCDIWCSRIG